MLRHFSIIFLGGVKMKYLNWFVILLIGWPIYFQIFLIVAVKRLIEAPNINTILSILSALFISIILEGDIIVLAVCNDNDE